MGLFSRPSKANTDDGQMELIEHLAELRSRIIRSFLYLFAGMILTYNLFPQIYNVLFAPAYIVLDKIPDAKPVFRSIQDAFLLRLETSLFAGIAVALPLIVGEIWGFVRPALTPEERKPVRFLAPFAGLLLLTGLGTGYGALPSAYGWMALYIPDIPGATLLQDAKDYLLLTVKILAAFGISFQLPVVLLFLARVGILNSKLMIQYWRHAVVLLATAAAVFTPTNDPATMLLMAIPMAGLYLLSILLVRAFEKRPDGSPAEKMLWVKLFVALVPVLLLAAVSFWLYKTNPTGRGRPHAITSTGVDKAFIQQANESAKQTKENTAALKDDATRIEALEGQVEAQGKQLEELTHAIEALRAELKPAPAKRP